MTHREVRFGNACIFSFNSHTCMIFNHGFGFKLHLIWSNLVWNIEILSLRSGSPTCRTAREAPSAGVCFVFVVLHQVPKEKIIQSASCLQSPCCLCSFICHSGKIAGWGIAALLVSMQQRQSGRTRTNWEEKAFRELNVTPEHHTNEPTSTTVPTEWKADFNFN